MHSPPPQKKELPIGIKVILSEILTNPSVHKSLIKKADVQETYYKYCFKFTIKESSIQLPLKEILRALEAYKGIKFYKLENKRLKNGYRLLSLAYYKLEILN